MDIRKDLYANTVPPAMHFYTPSGGIARAEEKAPAVSSDIEQAVRSEPSSSRTSSSTSRIAMTRRRPWVPRRAVFAAEKAEADANTMQLVINEVLDHIGRFIDAA